LENQDLVGIEPVLSISKRANGISQSMRAKADEAKEVVRRRFLRTLLTQKTEVILVKLNGLRSSPCSAVSETLEALNEKNF